MYIMYFDLIYSHYPFLSPLSPMVPSLSPSDKSIPNGAVDASVCTTCVSSQIQTTQPYVIDIGEFVATIYVGYCVNI